MFHSGDSALQAPCEGGGTLWFHKIMALSSTLVRTLGFQPGKFGSTPNRATMGAMVLITALKAILISYF